MTKNEKELYESNPRDLVLQWEDEGVHGLPLMFVERLSHDEIRDVLDTNKLSPRFLYLGKEEDRECDDCGAYLENSCEVDLCRDCQGHYAHLNVQGGQK